MILHNGVVLTCEESPPPFAVSLVLHNEPEVYLYVSGKCLRMKRTNCSRKVKFKVSVRLNVVSEKSSGQFKVISKVLEFQAMKLQRVPLFVRPELTCRPIFPPLPPDGVSVGLVHMRHVSVSSMKVQIVVVFLLGNFEFVEVRLQKADQLEELQMKLNCLLIQ